LGAGQGGGGEDGDVDFVSVLKEFRGGPKEAAEKVIRSEEEWERFIETCSSEATREALGEAGVDFDREMVIAVAMGDNRSILGDKFYEDQAGVQKVREGEGGLVVEYTNVHSDHLDTEPRNVLHVVKLPKAESVSFRKHARYYGG
jgi:hypothetical protein